MKYFRAYQRPRFSRICNIAGFLFAYSIKVLKIIKITKIKHEQNVFNFKQCQNIFSFIVYFYHITYSSLAKWLSFYHITYASLAKWLSIRLQTKWFCFQVLLQSYLILLEIHRTVLKDNQKCCFIINSIS